MNTVIIPEILLPSDAEIKVWAVNACDQYTSDLNYWKTLEKFVGDRASTLKLVYPEIYLNQNQKARIAEINETMRSYLHNGVFKSLNGLVLVERTLSCGVRRGIVLAIDLEDYSFISGENALIRSTEETVTERIPPRLEIRRNAPLELPHVMLLYDDKNNTVMNSVEKGEILYDAELNMGGGHVKGFLINNPNQVVGDFYGLIKDNFLFAVGDGNHSLATAKTHWNEIKKGLNKKEISNHPARFALVEAVNIYDGALAFEPIHRFVKTGYAEKFLKAFKPCGKETAYIVIGGEKHKLAFNENIPQGIRELDNFISNFIGEYGGETDYIHGEEQLVRLTKESGIGIILPSIKKDELFRFIKNGGNLPRKTFSMGEGNEKRYYIEAKRIK